ncbi:MAG: hypothetical protein IIA83_09230 [Thaumarchaeota archaeon]|nr:hypothetical protein [Nitrososphaerota archaeon]
MGLGKFLGKVASDVKERRKEKRESQRIAEDEYLEFTNKVNDLLDKFEISNFDNFLMKYLNNKPESTEEVDVETGKIIETKPSRKNFLDFVWSHLDDHEINYNQLKDFALKHRIVTPSFFGGARDEKFEQSDFESIIKTVRDEFEPEKIQNEEHLEAQLTIFLKAKFSDRKVQRQVITKNSDKLDIVVDDKYVFELKVPKSRSVLRDLNAQIEEYVEQYPNLCVVIADTSGVQDDGNDVEANLTQNIKEYADKYKVKHGVQTIIYDIVTRK